MINPNLLYEELSFDDFELEIELKTRRCAWESIEILDRTIYNQIYEWFYKVKNVGDKWEDYDNRSEKIIDICRKISLDAIILGDL
jgi:hypothetical protein